MPSDERTSDVVVVGAGTAGANAAYQLARRGLSVTLLERREESAAGAQWHNGVLDWQFERAGIDPPSAPERESGSGVTHLFGPDGFGVTVHDSPVVRADMGLLGARLRGLAAGAGTAIIDRVAAIEVDRRGDRIVGLDLVVGADDATTRRCRVEAALFVDATGRSGALRRQSPKLARWCPDVGGGELCTASDHHFRISDRGGAERFLESHGAAPGEGVTVVGVEGGWSTRAITVAEDLDRATVLVGCIAGGHYSTGPRMLEATREAEPWLGEDCGGGAGLIPLRRPYARFTAPGLALVGDAACQVFPAHGSGIGLGLIAGRMLANAVAGTSDPGDEATLWNYQADFWHEFGGVLAGFDAFRRLSTKLGGAGVGRMMSAGLITEDMSRAGLDQRWQAPAVSNMPAMIARMAHVPGISARMIPMLARAQLLRRLGARHPRAVDERALARWESRMVRHLGPVPT